MVICLFVCFDMVGWCGFDGGVCGGVCSVLVVCVIWGSCLLSLWFCTMFGF